MKPANVAFDEDPSEAEIKGVRKQRLRHGLQVKMACAYLRKSSYLVRVCREQSKLRKGVVHTSNDKKMKMRLFI